MVISLIVDNLWHTVFEGKILVLEKIEKPRQKKK
jgi:hypothetical protein